MKKAMVPSFLVAVMLLAGAAIAKAQQPAKIPRIIGFLGVTSPSTISARIEALRQGLRELGYEEGKNIVIEYRWAQGKFDRLPDLAAELVCLKVVAHRKQSTFKDSRQIE